MKKNYFLILILFMAAFAVNAQENTCERFPVKRIWHVSQDYDARENEKWNGDWEDYDNEEDDAAGQPKYFFTYYAEILVRWFKPEVKDGCKKPKGYKIYCLEADTTDLVIAKAGDFENYSLVGEVGGYDNRFLHKQVNEKLTLKTGKYYHYKIVAVYEDGDAEPSESQPYEYPYVSSEDKREIKPKGTYETDSSCSVNGPKLEEKTKDGYNRIRFWMDSCVVAVERYVIYFGIHTDKEASTKGQVVNFEQIEHDIVSNAVEYVHKIKMKENEYPFYRVYAIFNNGDTIKSKDNYGVSYDNDNKPIITTGVFNQQGENYKLEIYPNPVAEQEELSVKHNINPIDYAGATIEIYSSMGACLERIAVNSSEHTVRLKNKGIYFVRLKSKHFVRTEQLIVK